MLKSRENGNSNMADSEGFRDDRRRAISLLQEATRLIGEQCESSDFSTERGSNRETNHNTISQATQQHQRTNTQSSTSSTHSSSASSSSVSSTGNSVRERSLGNFRDLFAPYRSINRRSLSSSNQEANPPSKRKKHNAAPKFKPRETWTHTFFCLADREQIVAPSAALKARLQQAGLGRRKICFNWKATAGDVKTKLEEVYPKLETGGGFEIMRRGGAQVNDLIVIQPPRSGYSVSFLRDTAGLGQAIAFIRPIQINLDMQPEPLDMDNSEDTGSVPLVKCMNCETQVLITEIREHQQSCCKDDELLEVLSDEGQESNRVATVQHRIEEELECDVHTVECDDCHERFPAEDAIEHGNTCPGGTSGIFERRDSNTGRITDYFETTSTCPSHVCDTSEADVNSIKIVLPSMSASKIATALNVSNGNLQEAVELLLCGEDDDQSDSSFAGESLSELLKQMRPTPGARKRLIINRSSVFEDSVAYFKQRELDFSTPIKITFEGEPAVDGGGPVREFFTILMRELLSTSLTVRLFEGKDHCFIPIHNTDALRSNLFKVAGKMVTASVCHGGPGLPIFAKAIYSYFKDPNPDNVADEISKQDVVDMEVIEAVNKLDNVKQEDVARLATELQGLLIEAGFPHILTFENRFQAIMALCLHSVILSRKAELDQFISGLGPLINIVRKHPELAAPLFVAGCATPPTSEEVLSLVKYEDVDDKHKEFFQKYVREESTRLPGLLMFCTGCRVIPPMGFNPAEITVSQNRSVLPNANTCPLELEVPGNVEAYEDFKKNMDCAINAQEEGFGII